MQNGTSPEMTLSSSTITALQKVITGDTLKHSEQTVGPYLTGGEIVSFFGSIPDLDVGDLSLGTRWRYVQSVLERVNGHEVLIAIIEAAVHPVRFEDSGIDVDEAAAYLNKFLVYDGYTLSRVGRVFRLRSSNVSAGVISNVPVIDELSHEYIVEQLEKSEARLQSEDYDGAITTARALVEGILKALDARLPGEKIEAKGDLPKLYKAVSRKLNLNPSEHDVESIKLILRGLANTVYGLATLRNTMGDAHPRSFRPRRHHAQLAVNVARTITDFLAETYHYQVTASKVTGVGDDEQP